jgi:hypothetical protein
MPYHYSSQPCIQPVSPITSAQHSPRSTCIKGGMPSPPSDGARSISPPQHPYSTHLLSSSSMSREDLVGSHHYTSEPATSYSVATTSAMLPYPIAQHRPPSSAHHSAPIPPSHPHEYGITTFEMQRRPSSHAYPYASAHTVGATSSHRYEPNPYGRESAPVYSHGRTPSLGHLPSQMVTPDTSEEMTVGPSTYNHHATVHAEYIGCSSGITAGPSMLHHPPQYASPPMQQQYVKITTAEREHALHQPHQPPVQPAANPVLTSHPLASTNRPQTDAVSYASINTKTTAPNHAGNIVFSVGVSAASHRPSAATQANVTRASTNANLPPANTMASQITKFRATRRVVDKRDHQRRISHSAIERRRRERINDKMSQLRRLVPSCRGQDHLHKLSVLQYAIEYIHELRRKLGIKDEASDLDPVLNPAAADDADVEEDIDDMTSSHTGIDETIDTITSAESSNTSSRQASGSRAMSMDEEDRSKIEDQTQYTSSKDHSSDMTDNQSMPKRSMSLDQMLS